MGELGVSREGATERERERERERESDDERKTKKTLKEMVDRVDED